MMRALRHILRFRRDQRGATAVEFAILMPIMMVCFGAIVEGARIYWNYQAAVSGVRDATRNVARITDPEICVGLPTGFILPEPSLIANAVARERVDANMGTGAANLFPTSVDITGISTRLLCVATPGHVQPVTPVAVVRARVQVDLPFSTVFEVFGARDNTRMISWITDQARIYGL